MFFAACLHWKSGVESKTNAATIIVAKISRVSDSCGLGVPKYEYVKERKGLTRWAESKGSAGLIQYKAENNSRSIDGLPGLDVGE
jgi:hypothetical protein